MLDSRIAVWSGQVLPGMHAQMTVEERPAHEDPSGCTPDSTDWSTRLAVSLPRLGTVDAQLTLRGNRLVLSIAAGEATTATELGTARGQLAQALSDAGLQVDTLQVALR
jgi:hypothetical protein